MELADCYYLGRLTRPHGLNGSLHAHLDTDEPHRYTELAEVYLLRNGQLQRMAVHYLSLPKGQQVLIEFESIDTFEDAQALVGSELYLPLAHLPPLAGDKTFYYHEVRGWRVIDEARGEIGTVLQVAEMPAQDLLEVQHGRHRVLVPLVDEFILRVDRESQALHLRLPQGLIELFVEGSSTKENPASDPAPDRTARPRKPRPDRKPGMGKPSASGD